MCEWSIPLDSPTKGSFSSQHTHTHTIPLFLPCRLPENPLLSLSLSVVVPPPPLTLHSLASFVCVNPVAPFPSHQLTSPSLSLLGRGPTKEEERGGESGNFIVPLPPSSPSSLFLVPPSSHPLHILPSGGPVSVSREGKSLVGGSGRERRAGMDDARPFFSA